MIECDRCGRSVTDNEMYGIAELVVCNSVNGVKGSNLPVYPTSTGRQFVCLKCTSDIMQCITKGREDIRQMSLNITNGDPSVTIE